MLAILVLLRQAVHALPLVCRRLRKSLATTLVCLVGLGLGSGSVAAILAVVDVVFLRSLPYARAHELVVIRGGEFDRTVSRGLPVDTAPWLRDCPAVTSAAFFLSGELSLVRRGAAMRVRAGQVSPDFFQTLASEPLAGRVLGSRDSITTGPVTTVLSHALWTRLGSPAQIVGESLSVEGRPMTVVGIMPPGFDFPRRTELWVSSPDNSERPILTGALRYEFIGRLRPGLEAAAATPVLARCRPASADAEPTIEDVAAIPLRQHVFGRLVDIVPWLQAASLLVLLIAAFNVVILQFADEDQRAAATAVSVALGADEGVLRGHSVARFLVLAAAGSLLGLACGWALLRALQPLLPAILAGLFDGITLGPRSILGVVAVCVLVTLAAAAGSRAFAPATERLLESLRSGTGIWHRTGNAASGRSLLALEIAFATALLVSVGLLASSFHRLLGRDPGIVAEHVSVAHLSLVGPRYEKAPARLATLRTLLADLNATPDLRHAAATSELPFRASVETGGPVRLAESPLALDDERLPQPRWRVITPGYFETLGIRLLRGRDFSAFDEARGEVTIVNRRLADALGPGLDLVGQRLEFEDGLYEVIGVVGDVRHQGLALDAAPEAYFSVTGEWAPRTMTLVASAPELADAQRAAVLRRVLARETSDTAFEIETLSAVMAAAQQTRGFAMSLVQVFAAIAVILAAIGVFAGARQSVVRRRGEFAVRLALGSSRSQVCGNVVVPALRWGSFGVAGGVGLGLALHRALEAALPSIDVNPGSGVVVWAVLAIYVCLVLATSAPALDAARTNAADLLRS